MTLSRRRFLGHGAPLGLLPFMPACGAVEGLGGLETEERASSVNPFVHGVASGDPLADGVILWTRITTADGAGAEASGADAGDVDVAWRVAADPEMTQVVAAGTERATAERDHTVKVDVRGLGEDTTYYYDFSALGVRSGVGRTHTLPGGGAVRARLAVTSCANYPAGFFNVYRLIARRDDVDLVLHLGDYLYEYANGTFGDGEALGRLPEPNRELVSLADYRARHAQYKLDADLQELHRSHPFVAIWDDHEVSNNGFRDGAGNHQPDSEGDWEVRKQGAMRAYFEWMPIRPASPGDVQRIYRQFAYGDLFDLLLLDTRFAGRDARIASNCDRIGIDDPARSLLGAEQEAWFFDALRASSGRGAGWRIIGQQVMMGQLSDIARGCVTHPDQWDGYAQSRARLLGLLRTETISNVVVLTGDAHSSWAFDLAENPFDGAAYEAASGRGSLAVEFVTPSVSSPSTFVSGEEDPAALPHLKYLDLFRHGYILVDVTAERVQAEWYLVSSVVDASADEALSATFQVRAGENHLVPGAVSGSADAGAPFG
jgi:alkaline phosphatase D